LSKCTLAFLNIPIKFFFKDILSKNLIHSSAPDRIVNGSIESPKNSNPWQVLISNSKDVDDICGGTLLTNIFVLTAAHCITSDFSASSTIIAGASTR
jgi:secreted trypsin-like serine protease